MKRTLALVLALVMVFGLMAFPASADFTDDAEIKYVEAVDVMSAIGVIDGFEDGSFDPDGLLTREQAAKVVAYLRLNASDADKLATTGAPFDDVAADRWSAGYISYCVSEGIINGRDENTFDPTGNITGYEFAKLMLGALGYDSEIEGYTGSSWAIEVSKDALTVGLFDGNKGADYNQPITREEAALYAFNMLQSDVVDYEDRGTVIDLGGGVSIVTGASQAKAIANDADDDTIKSDEVLQYAERYFEDLEKNAGEHDAFGRPSTEWTYDGDDVGTYSDEADFTYTVGTKGKEIYSDLDKPGRGTVYEYIIDGRTIGEIGNVYEDFAIASGNDEKIGGNGTLIEIYERDKTEDGDEVYTIVVINTFVGTISEWNEADEDDDTEENVVIAPYTEPDDVVENYNFGLDEEFETTKFTEDDADDETVVIYTAAYDEGDGTFVIKSMDAADSEVGFISRTTGESSFVLGGETYKYSKYHEGQAAYDSTADDATIYLDSYGYCIYIDMDAASSTDYAYVEDATVDTDAWDEDTYLAKLVLDDGTVVTATVDRFYDADGERVDNTEDFGSNDVNDYDETIVEYRTTSDGDYRLYALNAGLSEDADATFDITSGRASIRITDDGGVETIASANSSTIFIIGEEDDGDYEYSVYTGIKNVPDVEGGYYAIYTKEDSSSATVVVVIDPTSASTSTSEDYVYLAYDNNADVISGDDYDDHYVVNAVVDGEITEVLVAAEEYDNIFADEADAYGKSIKYNSDDLATDITGTLDTDTGKADGRVEDGVLTLADAAYTVAEDCEVFTVEDAEITSSTVRSVRDGNDVVVILDDDDVVTAIFILK